MSRDDELYWVDAGGPTILVGRDLDQIRRGLEILSEQRRARLAQATPEQLAVSWGDHFLNRTVVPRTGEPVTVYARVSTLDEVLAEERASGALLSDLPTVRDSVLRFYRDGMRFGYHYSVVEPTGEWGSTHVADVTPITAEEFLEARSRRWSP